MRTLLNKLYEDLDNIYEQETQEFEDAELETLHEYGFHRVTDFPLNRHRFQVVQTILGEVVDDLKRTINKSTTWVHTISDYNELLDNFMSELKDIELEDAGRLEDVS